MALNSLCADVPLRNYSVTRKPICCKADNTQGLLPLLAQPGWQPGTWSTPLPTVAVGSHVTHGIGMHHGHVPIWVARFIYRDDRILQKEMRPNELLCGYDLSCTFWMNKDLQIPEHWLIFDSQRSILQSKNIYYIFHLAIKVFIYILFCFRFITWKCSEANRSTVVSTYCIHVCWHVVTSWSFAVVTCL